MKCPICKQEMKRVGLWTNKVELQCNENGSPNFFEDEVEEFRAIGSPDEIFWKCFECSLKVIEEEK